MKKIIVWILALAMLPALAACGRTAAPAQTAAPAVEESAPAPAEAAPTGKVYWLSMRSEADEALQQLAAAYTAQTGVEVKVAVAAPEEYEAVLRGQMAGDEAPTLFNIRGAAALQTWDAYALPLDGTAVMDELTTAEYSLVNRAGETKAIPWLYETAGLVVNRALLEEAGYTLDMLNGFDALRNMAVSIHDRKAGLNFDAFTSVGMDRFSGRFAPLDLLNTALFCELRDGGISEPPAAISGTYLDRFRALWNVWIIDSPADVYNLGASTGARAEERFAEGGAVFYPSGSWAYRRLTEDWGMAPGDLAIVPFYCGVPGEENAGLSTGSENRWAVNANAPEADREAALAFLAWCASSEEGLRILSGIGDVPFRAAPATTNAFTAEAAALRAAGRYNVAWVYGYAPNLESWTDSLRGTLIKYSAAIEDVNWADVTAACVDGWQIEYAIVNG